MNLYEKMESKYERIVADERGGVGVSENVILT